MQARYDRQEVRPGFAVGISGSVFGRFVGDGAAQRIGPNVAVVRNVIEADAYAFRYARLLHRDAVKRRGSRHRLLAVGNNDKTRPTEKVLEDVDETANVRLVEWGIDFVQHAEGAGAELEDREQKGTGSARLFAAGEK